MYVHIFQRSTLKCLEMSVPGMTLDSPETEEKPQGSVVVVSGPVQGMNSRSPVQSWESFIGNEVGFSSFSTVCYQTSPPRPPPWLGCSQLGSQDSPGRRGLKR